MGDEFLTGRYHVQLKEQSSVPRADDSFVKAIVARRSGEFTQMQEGQTSFFAKFLTKKWEENLGTDYPDLLKQRQEHVREAWTEYRKKVQSVFNR